MIDTKITGKYVVVVIVSVLFTWIIHEFAHWAVSELLGYDTIMRLNGVFPKAGENPTEVHSAIVSISGPVITILQAIITFLLLKQKWSKSLYPLLFTAFYMRFLASLMNFIETNDEGRVSEFLGMGTFTLAVIISIFLFYMVFKISKKYTLTRKFQLVTTIIVMLASSVLILSDQFFKIQLLQ